MNNIIIHPYIFEARSPPDSNKSAALQGAWAKRFTYVASVLNISKESILSSTLFLCFLGWSKIHLIGLVFSRKDLRYRFQVVVAKKTYTTYSNENEHVGEQLLEDQRNELEKAKTFNVSFDEYTGPSENDRIEIPDDSEILDVEPLSGWEFDTLMPSWLKKAMDRHKTLTTAQTDPLEKFELAKQPIWWRIIDASDPKIVQDFISEEEFSELNAIFSNILNIGHQNDWTVLEPVAERCLQSLAKLNNEQIRMIGEMFKYEGIHGAVCKLRKIIQNIEELNIEEPDLFDDEPTNNKTLSLVLEKNDYLDKEVGYILELVRYT
ncbi:uncharacterized protein OCT59_001703 [Rhizophagus irregularis]|uniref:uncharacterized protein n=1 Tax=Rhizophagus irregularis TaxID=588596 RepID=UPI003325BCE2|nr:hypothetical protein OCT59_001703 [Rhizophagus irregularis]